MLDNDDASFEFDDLTEADFAVIDTLEAQLQGTAEPAVEIQIEPTIPTQDGVTSESLPNLVGNSAPEGEGPSPSHHRRGKVFTVTDLSSPSWCEVQYDYGLRQKRSRPIAKRPKTFVSSRGKEISVEPAVAAQNERRTSQGKAIHKELEREIRLEEVLVDVTTEEELWALRFLSMLTALQSTLVEGFTRELPVFGIVAGEVVVGIIDEVIRRPATAEMGAESGVLPVTSPGSKRRRLSRALSHSQENQQVSADIPIPVHDSGGPQNHQCFDTDHRPSFVLHIIDTKTRRANSIPQHEDTLPSRLQLMLYYLLLSDLLSASSPYDFANVWQKLGLSPQKPFSAKFLAQSGLTPLAGETLPSCLTDLPQLWNVLLLQLDLCGVDPTLQLVYRLQPKKYTTRMNGKARMRERGDTLQEVQEADDLARAIEASLQDLRESPSILAPQSGPEDTSSGPSEQKPLSGNDDGGVLAVARSIVEDSNNQESTPDIVGLNEQTVGDYKIIGTKKFMFDKEFVLNHVSSILGWWHGRREPRGVPVELSRRCFTCEYCADCEWREQKAEEFRLAKGRE